MNRRDLIVIVNVVCLLIIVLSCTQLVLGWCQFREDCGKKILTEAVFHREKNVERKPLDYYSVIDSKGLFGEGSSRRSQVITPEAAFDLRLRGTVVLSSGRGYAILENVGNGAQGLYRLNEKVGNLTLIGVKWGKVVLSGSGGEKVLAMISPEPAGISTVEENETEVKQVAEAKHIVSRSFVEKAVGNANEILTQVRIKPHFVSGISQGYWVGNIQPGSIIEKMGLQNGDVIKKVNGQVLDSPEKIFQIYQKVQGTGVIAVEVERDSRIETLTYEIRD